MGLIEQITSKKIKVFPISDGYRFYGQTYEVRDELKQVGAIWNTEKKAFEINNDNFSKLNCDLREFIFKTILQSRVESVKVVSEAIMNETIKLYPKGDVYRVYGKTKEIYKDLLNTSFKLENKNYEISIKSFNDEYPEEVRIKVNSEAKEVAQVCSEELEE